jgi:hypothetical protein
MGLQYSRSRVAVNSVIKAGINVVAEMVQDSNSGTVSGQSINLINCPNAKISNISQKQFITVSFSSIVTQLGTTEVTTKIDEAVKAAAQAEATGALGLSAADSAVALTLLTDISQQIQTTSKSVFSQSTLVTQAITCSGSAGGEISYIDQSQTVKVVASSVVTQTTFNSAMIDIISKLDALSSAKATGYDPLGIVGLLAVVVIVGIIALAAGGSFAGVGMAKNLTKSPYFWMSILGVVSTMFAVGVAAGALHFWPGKTPDNVDTPTETESKSKVNTAVITISSIGLVASLGGIGAIAYFSFFRHRK